jgi:hypothetical protein
MPLSGGRLRECLATGMRDSGHASGLWRGMEAKREVACDERCAGA